MQQSKLNEMFHKIRVHYEYLTPRILEANRKFRTRWVSPYSEHVDWPNFMSDIEFMTWMAIRSFGAAPLYPQYPAGKYFVDFGNPFVKVAIECDGKEFHKDAKKDMLRIKDLYELGWTVYRISGADIHKMVNDEYYNRYEYEREQINDILSDYYSTVEGLINAIAIIHLEYKHYDEEAGEYKLAQTCLAKRLADVPPNTLRPRQYFSNMVEYFEQTEMFLYERPVKPPLLNKRKY